MHLNTFIGFGYNLYCLMVLHLSTRQFLAAVCVEFDMKSRQPHCRFIRPTFYSLEIIYDMAVCTGAAITWPGKEILRKVSSGSCWPRITFFLKGCLIISLREMLRLLCSIVATGSPADNGISTAAVLYVQLSPSVNGVFLIKASECSLCTRTDGGWVEQTTEWKTFVDHVCQ